MESKILFLDIDDTLLTKDKAITDENADAIACAIKAGHRIVIASGRPLLGILPLAERLGIAGEGGYIIAMNGAEIYDCGTGRYLLRETLAPEDVEALFREAERHGLYVHTYDGSTVLAKADGPELRWYVGQIHVPYRIVPELPAGLHSAPAKVLIASLSDHEALEVCRKDAAPRLLGRVSLFFSSKKLLECVKDGVSKGNAVTKLCGLLGIPIRNSFAAGDSENDIPMLLAAGLGCAMANATDACKDAASYVTERDCNHSGVAEIIEKFIL